MAMMSLLYEIVSRSVVTVLFSGSTLRAVPMEKPVLPFLSFLYNSLLNGKFMLPGSSPLEAI